MNDTKLIRLAGILVVGLLACGCRPKKQPTMSPPPNPQSPAYGNVDQRMSELQQRGTELTQVAQQLPGRTSEDDRRLVVAAFDRAAAALELLGGPNPPGSFRQALRIVDNTRQQLSSGSAASDAAIDSGLRAIHNALIDVRQRAFPDDADVQKLQDELRNRISELDRVRGPMHTVVVGHAFVATSNVINRMAGEFEERNAPAQPQQAAAPVAPPQAPVAPQPPVAPAPPVAPQPAAPPAAALPPAPPANGQPTADQVEQMRRELEQLRQENARLKQQQQQQLNK